MCRVSFQKAENFHEVERTSPLIFQSLCLLDLDTFYTPVYSGPERFGNGPRL